MKKIIINLGLAICLGIAATGCSDFLDEPVLGKENLETYFKTEEECIKQITGCYESVFFGDWWQVSSFYVGLDMATDDLWMGNTTQSQSGWIRIAHYGNPKQDDNIKNFWEYRYKGILRSNLCVQRIPTAPIANDMLKKRLVAEAKFLRAFHYFELVKVFGGVPIVDNLKMPNELEGITRSSVSDSYAFIEKDLLEAAADLPQRSEYDASDLGRATKGAAYAYLGKVYLYQEKYKEAAEILKKEVIDTHEYDLLKFEQVWSVEHNNSIESIFEVQYSPIKEYSLGGRLAVFTGSRDDSGWSWGLPTSNLEKAFIDAGDTERLKWTIVKHGQDVPGETAAEGKAYAISPDKHKSARINRKFYIPRDQRGEPYDSNHNPLNHRLMRYADVLLMYAEAANQLGGQDNEARNALNRIRTRAKLPEINQTVSGKNLQKAIRLERRLELALEHQRLFDLRRWTDENGKKALANVMGPSGSFVKYNMEESTDVYELTNKGENSNKGITFQENRDLLFPIPNSEVILSRNSIEQNPNF